MKTSLALKVCISVQLVGSAILIALIWKYTNNATYDRPPVFMWVIMLLTGIAFLVNPILKKGGDEPGRHYNTVMCLALGLMSILMGIGGIFFPR